MEGLYSFGVFQNFPLEKSLLKSFSYLGAIILYWLLPVGLVKFLRSAHWCLQLKYVPPTLTKTSSHTFSWESGSILTVNHPSFPYCFSGKRPGDSQLCISWGCCCASHGRISSLQSNALPHELYPQEFLPWEWKLLTHQIPQSEREQSGLSGLALGEIVPCINFGYRASYREISSSQGVTTWLAL